VVTGFRRGVNEVFALSGCCTALIGSYRRFDPIFKVQAVQE